MAAADKARFYLEKSVPDLQDLSRKGVFSNQEISAIARKRSDFEHVLNAPGSRPGDYVRYATYEMNLEALRRKRCKRLSVKNTAYSGQRTVFFILDRATKKFPGDLGLWMQYIQFCQKEKASKRLARVFTSVLRLKPRDWGLWVLAAKHYAEGQGDMATARSYLQRGLRFCGDEKRLYLEYAKLEMVYLAKLSARRRLLGLDEQQRDQEKARDGDEDMIALPDITAEDLNPEAGLGIEEVNQDALARLANAPVFTGAIPMAIFDAAMKQFDGQRDVAEEFFELVAEFHQVPAASKVLQHILDHLEAAAPDSAETTICQARISLDHADSNSVEFPAALGNALATVNNGLSRIQSGDKARLAEKAAMLLLPYLRLGSELDEDLATVIGFSTKRYLRILDDATATTGVKAGGRVQQLVARLHKDDRHEEAEVVLPLLDKTHRE